MASPPLPTRPAGQRHLRNRKTTSTSRSGKASEERPERGLVSPGRPATPTPAKRLGEELQHLRVLRRSAALSGAALSVVLAMASLTPGMASAVTQQISAGTPATSIVPNVAPETSGALSQVCSTPKQQGVASCLVVRNDKGRTGYGVRLGAATAPSGYGPSDLLGAYDLPANGGEGATIAIVDAYDDPNAAADLAVYREQFGLPALAPGQFRKVNQEGFPGDYPAGDPDWATEISLDLDMISAIAPKADIILVEANSANLSDLGAAVNEAVALGASYVSNSYGGPDSSEDLPAATQDYDHPGVAVVASAGDSGYGAEFPASAPDVTAVGGTSLTRAPGTARGWTETAWSKTGSGCSADEPKPSFQSDTGCAGRTVADVSAVADPDTGVAVYDTYSDGAPDYGQGWGQYGGTSVASPVITATYALGGPIATGDYPNADPYAHTSDLNDVTSGSNGTCSPAYLCTAGPGYDGPTGLGTPSGLGAFTDTSYGTLTGTVASTTGRPVADAQIRLTGAATVTTITQANGSYRVRLPAGDYSMAVSAYGYTAAPAASGVSVTAGGTTARSVRLRAEPLVTLSGTVKDGSGQGWPVQSTVLLDYGTGAVQTSTDPITGRYSLRVPGDSGYQVQVTPELIGYQTANTTITVGATDATRDFTVAADLLASEGSALGYQQNTSGTAQTFAAGTLPSGWSTSAASGTPWGFFDAADWSASGWPSGTGVAYALALGDGPTDTSLYTSPVAVPAGQSPLVSFYSSFGPGALAEVDVTTDGGTAWQTEWTASTTSVGQFQFTVPSASSARTVQLRFRLQGTDSTSDVGVWLITNVRLGAAWLTPTPGGLVEGHVTDASTGAGIDGASVAVTGQADSTASTAPVAGPGDGFYYLLAPTGRQAVTAAQLNYGTAHATVDVTAGSVTRSDFALPAGRLAAHEAIKATVAPGGTITQNLTLTNTGSRPATFAIDQFPGTNTPGTDPAVTKAAITPAGTAASGTTAADTSAQGSPASQTGPATVRTMLPGLRAAASEAKKAAADGDTREATVLRRLRVITEQAPADAGNGPAYVPPAARASSATSSGPAWSALPDMPAPMFYGVAAAYGGRLYEGLGVSGSGLATGLWSDLNSYDPANGTWTQEASAPIPSVVTGYGVIGDSLYLTGGFDITGAETPTQVYDFTTNTWSEAAADPYAFIGTDAVLGGKLYQIGGEDPSTLAPSDAVSVYDPSTGTWSQAPSYPIAISGQACGVMGGTVYCAGGENAANTAVSAAYKYTPGDSSWQQIASLPAALGSSAFGMANGELLVSGGQNASGANTAAGYAYNPAMNWWTPIAATPFTLEGAAGAAGPDGFYAFGGIAADDPGIEEAYVLSGYSQSGPVSLPWLSLSQATGTIQPGHSVTITIRLNASGAGLSRGGTVTAALGLETDTPYEVTPVPVSLTVR